MVHALLKGKIVAAAIDPFANYGELPSVDMSGVEDRFTCNMRAIGAEVRTLRGTSIEFLPKLIAAGEELDLIFIDGSHSSLDVTDATRAGSFSQTEASSFLMTTVSTNARMPKSLNTNCYRRFRADD